MRKYYSFSVKKLINIKKLVTIEYIENKDFILETEEHNFCELAYVDSGELICFDNNEQTTLSQGELFFVPQHVKHSYQMLKEKPSAIFIACFECSSSLLELLHGKNVLSSNEKSILSNILSEAKNAFVFPFNKKIVPLDSPVFGSNQLVENHIEALLISLIRSKLDTRPDIKFVMNSMEFNSTLVNDIVNLLKKNLYGRITLEELQSTLFYSKTYLNNNFKKVTGNSIMQYYRAMKIDEAKKLLKLGDSISSISEALQFENPNYFCKVFKSTTGLTPSKYKKTL